RPASLGSQAQYRPQDASAQIGPAISAPNVQIGNANACSLNVSRSSTPASGARRPSEYGNDRLPASYPLRIRYSTAGTTPTRKMPDEITTAATCTTNQAESSAGTSG